MMDPAIAELRKTRPADYHYILTREQAIAYREVINRMSSLDLREEYKTCDHRGRQDIVLEELRNR